MDLDGGLPRRLTWDPSGAVVLGWTPDGRSILFRSQRYGPTWRDRLWTVPAAGGSAQRLPVPYGEFASLQADGQRLAYVPVSAEWQHWKLYRGGEADDIWLADLAAGTFRRLTDAPGVDTEPLWVGEEIYFLSDRGGHANLYRMNPSGGEATAETSYTDYDLRYPGTDGKRVIFEHGNGLALYDPASRSARELTFELHSDRIHARERRVSATKNLFEVALGPTGKRLLVSARGQILSAPVEEGDVRAIAAQPGSRGQYPAWSPDGKEVAYVSDESGEEQIWIAPSSGGTRRQVTRDHQGPLGPLVWSPDGKRIATSDREMRIFLVEVGSGAFTLVDQADRGGSYDLVNRSYRFSPDGKWLAYARQEPNWNWSIRLYDVAARKSVQVSNPEMNSSAPAFDPAGECLYFLSDRAFDPRFVNANRYFSYDRYTKVSLVTLAADRKSPFLTRNDQEGAPSDSLEDDSDGLKKDREAAGGPEKKRDAGKKGSTEDALPKVRIDADGLAARIAEVPVPADHYIRVEPVKGRLLLETDAESPGPGHPARQLRAFDLKKKQVKVLVDSLSDFQVSADHKKILLQDEQSFTVVDADVKEIPKWGDDDAGKEKDRVNTDGWDLVVDPAAEWRQIFHETWRVARDFFYDPAMHGVDWDGVRRKYEALLPAVADRSDLNFLLGEMISELNCGHAYVGGGDLPETPHLPMGFLGADLEPVAGATPACRVTRILPGDEFDLEARSPLLTPGIDVKPGDYILAVAGRPVRADQDIQSLLAGTAGRPTVLQVNSRPSMEGAREVLVRPLGSERQARYYDWVESRRAYVREHGGPNIGYLHIPNMGDSGLREFAKHYYTNLAKDGMIYDVRYNSGGYIDAMLLLQMSSRPYSYFKPRYGASWTRQDWAFAGHSVALCNDQSYSDAEEFCDAFQRLRLGPVIGVRSWGGEVGSGGGYPLLDGGKIYIPNYGEWADDGTWVIEGRGVTPDITVEDDPAAIMAGRDPQLDRAIQELRSKIAAQPVPRPAPPPFPSKAGRGSDLGER
jgi:tricorn protease